MAGSQNNRHALLADRIFDGRNWHRNAAVLFDQKGILGLAPWAEVPSEWSQTRLPPGGLLAPGFIDLQVNGGGGVLLNDDPTLVGMQTIARAHRRYGTTACLPTLITDTRDQMRAAIQAARSINGADGILGLHLEGPFISPLRPGVHRTDRIIEPAEEDLEYLRDLSSVGQSIITLAPERVARSFVRSLAMAGVLISIGHSEATASDVAQAIADGVSGITHLFNAMPPLSARSPGIIGVALSEPRLTAGLILDGIHVDPVAVRAAFAAKGSDKIALVTDAMPTVGSSLDRFQLQGRMVRLHEGRLTTETGTLAGSHLDMASAVRNAVRLAELPLEAALRAASFTPAQFLGLEKQRGALIPDARVDLVALDDELNVISTWVGGHCEYESLATPTKK